MHYECFICSEYFHENRQVVEHLKIVHELDEKRHQIKCTVRNSNCDRDFSTFSGLSRHVKSCISNHDIPMVSKIDQQAAETATYDNRNSIIFNATASMLSDADHDSSQIAGNDFIYESINDMNVCSSDGFLFNSSESENGAGNGSIREDVGFSIEQFLSELLQLNMRESDVNTLFTLVEKMLGSIQAFCLDSIKTHIENPLEALETAMSFIRNDLHKFSSTYKRKLAVEKNELYVKPRGIAIGTQWEISLFSSTFRLSKQ